MYIYIYIHIYILNVTIIYIYIYIYTHICKYKIGLGLVHGPDAGDARRHGDAALAQLLAQRPLEGAALPGIP